MARPTRKKSAECMYHVMSRSISELDLFRCDEDKDYYLFLLKERIERYHCKIYAYCLMSNHVHIYINPCGYDISIFMLSLNTAYVSYYNRKYNRHGHLYQGRFASTIVDNDTYSLTLSAYIHNNAKDLPSYSGKEELYKYSSYGIYTGYRKDIEGLIDTEFILHHFSNNITTARQRYRQFTESMKDTGIMKEVDDKIIRAYTENEYKSEKRYISRDSSPSELVNRIAQLLGKRVVSDLRAKYVREASNTRAFVTYVMRTLCDYSYSMICKYIGNMSMSGVVRLANQGFKLHYENKMYRDAFNSLICTEY